MRLLLLLALLLPCVAMAAGAPKRRSTATGRIERIAVHSPQLGADRELLVWLPPGYTRGKARYRVVYLHDAQNVFDAATSFGGHEWKADEAAAALAREGTPVIVVAMPHGGDDRIAEYTPFPWPARKVDGRADRHLAFLVDTVKPLVDRRYRTKPGAADTVVAGSSLGGLVSLYAAVSRPDVFGRAGVLSPSLWIADRAIFDWLARHPARPGQRFWVDMGTKEGATLVVQAQGVADVRRLAELLTGQDATVKLEIVEAGQHDEEAWAKRWPGALRWLLADE